MRKRCSLVLTSPYALLYIFSLPHSLPIILIHALLLLLLLGRGRGVGPLVAHDLQPKNCIYTDPAQPRRTKKYVYIKAYPSHPARQK
jgi:hypothetical protein